MNRSTSLKRWISNPAVVVDHRPQVHLPIDGKRETDLPRMLRPGAGGAYYGVFQCTASIPHRLHQ